jgi:uncharacterized RDD family membrane protein YckC
MAVTGRASAFLSRHGAMLPYAGFQLRAVALLLDIIVMLSFALLFFTIAFLPITIGGDDTISSGEEQWLIMVGFSYVPFAFILFFVLWAWRGQSIGMMAVRIEITDRDGEPLSPARALLRTLVWPLSMLPFAIGAVPVFFDDERRALHDTICGTVVLELP